MLKKRGLSEVSMLLVLTKRIVYPGENACSSSVFGANMCIAQKNVGTSDLVF